MLEVFEDLTIPETEGEEVFREYEFDFEKRKLTGRIVEGKDAVKIWAFFALQIARFKFRAFSHNYGNDFDEMIGKNYGIDYTKSEIQRMISDSLSVHPDIESLENFDFSFENGTLTVNFDLLTKYGTQSFVFLPAGDF